MVRTFSNQSLWCCYVTCFGSDTALFRNLRVESGPTPTSSNFWLSSINLFLKYNLDWSHLIFMFFNFRLISVPVSEGLTSTRITPPEYSLITNICKLLGRLPIACALRNCLPLRDFFILLGEKFRNSWSSSLSIAHQKLNHFIFANSLIKY